MTVITEPIKNVVFRSAKFTDLNTLSRLIKHYYAFDHIAFDTSTVRGALKTMLKTKSVGHAFLIVRQTKQIGYTILTYGFDLEFGGRTALLTDLYLEPEYRHLGIGRRTIHFLEEFCRNNNIGALELQVERTNKAAQRFYRRLKFEMHDRMPMTKRL